MFEGTVLLSSDRDDGDAAFWARPLDRILDDFEAISAHDSGLTAKRYRSAIRAAIRRFAAVAGHEPRLSDVLLHPDLLARVLSSDRALRSDRQVSVATIQHAVAGFRTLIAATPPPPGATRGQLRRNLEEARAGIMAPHGLRLQYAVGQREERPVYTPTRDEIAQVIAWLDERGGRDGVIADLVAFTALCGARIGTVLVLQVRDLIALPDGTLWLHATEKHRHDRRPLLVSPRAYRLVARWMSARPDDPLWEYEDSAIAYGQVRVALARACRALSIPRFTPHALRRAFARDLLPALGLQGVMRAGGWTVRAVVEHYLDRAAGKDARAATP